MKTDGEIAKAAGLTIPGVRYKRNRGWSDDEIITGQVLSSGEDLVDAQRRKEIALADLRELELEEKRGQLVSVIEAQNAWSTLILLIRNKFTAMPNAISEQLASITESREVRQFLTGEIDRVLTQLAEEFQTAAIETLGDGASGDRTAGTPDCDGVGGKE